MDKTLRVKQRQYNQFQDLKQKHGFAHNWQVFDYLLKNQKYYESLENIITKVHIITKLK